MFTTEKFKPKIHFSPAFGWINDPNGLVFSQGKWHLFYQYYPMNTIWGPMHWGHAVSTDLINWEHQPIAICPDELGHMFSGSAVIDRENVSGLFGQKSEDNLMIFYTASMPRHNVCPDDLQTQCVAYSQNGGLTWSKYEKNPILPNPDLFCYRDPKVVWYEPTGNWIMVLTHGQTVGIYKSGDLLNWQFCSEFGEGEGHHSLGPWECPDLFRLEDENGAEKWVLVVGVGPHDTDTDYGQTPCTQYFIGEFDGERFINQNSPDKILWLDEGCDFYATQSFYNAPEDKRIGISWMSNWSYARNTDTGVFRGVMTLPREFHLVRNSAGENVLAQSFMFDVDGYFDNEVVIEELGFIDPKGSVFRINAELSLPVNDTASLALFGLPEPVVQITRVAEGYEIRSIRQYIGTDEVMQKEFPHDYKLDYPTNSQTISFEMIVDHGATELLLDGGRLSMTQLHYPERLDGIVALQGQGWTDVNIQTKTKQMV